MTYRTRIVQDVQRPVLRKCGVCQEIKTSIHYDMSIPCALCANCAGFTFEAEQELISCGIEHPDVKLVIKNP